MVRELTKSGKVFNSRCTFSFLRTAPSRLLRRKQKPVPRYYSVRVTLLLQRKPHGRNRQRLLALSALALRLLRQPRANAVIGPPNGYPVLKHSYCPLQGESGCPSGYLFLQSHPTHPGRAKRVLPRVGPVVPTLASPPAGASRWSSPLSAAQSRRGQADTMHIGRIFWVDELFEGVRVGQLQKEFSSYYA